ncbi:DUF4249 domain-containing protein [Marixanthomonas spongiae]|uniref:DUF4249 domain-containing protein n=1 Tax=Marixanthomonas spongiae TaxID=2174845 RepID=UPI001402B8D6|nr:DUF4249 domain-containing protein [Marixanthomonas spongiae]
MKLKKVSVFSLVLTVFLFCGCVEEIDFETETFESALVVEATITNETKPQKIKLSRTFRFEEDGPSAETNATVLVKDNMGNQFSFEETDVPGIYQSTTTFSAQPDRDYELSITTANGRSYGSDPTALASISQIDNLYAQRETNENGALGVAIFLDSYNPDTQGSYYRFEFEETYKIVSRYFAHKDIEVVSYNPPKVKLVRKNREEYTCYNTIPSTNILLANTNPLSEDRLSQFQIRFLKRENPKISTRYSLLAKQFVISRDAYVFYETLKDFSGSESLFSQVQPGFISGNLFSTSNDNEKVIGFFELAAVSSKRVFFNYSDYFSPEEGPLGLFVEDCELNRPEVPALVNLVGSGAVKFVEEPIGPGNDDIGYGPYLVAPVPCVDCTVFGTNVVPEFWEE